MPTSRQHLHPRDAESSLEYSLEYDDTTGPRPGTTRPSQGRSRGRRPTTAVTSNVDDQEIVCAISESRGQSPTIGLAFVNISTSEAVLCQICDSQTYVRTCHKLKVFSPSEILYMSTVADTKLLAIIREDLEVDRYGIELRGIDRRYWSEANGHEYLEQLALPDDLESLKVSVAGNYFALCCFAAALKYIELAIGTSFYPQSLRLRFEPSEGSMLIDLSTIVSLELIQNLQNAKSKDCLLGVLNQTLTPMGHRFLRSNLLQPSTDLAKINDRYDALGELTTKEAMFFGVRQALKNFVDTDRLLGSLVTVRPQGHIQHTEQAINQIVTLKTFVDFIKPIWQALTGAVSEELHKIRQLCEPENYQNIRDRLHSMLNEDVTYSRQPLEMRNQRTYAIKAGVNGFLDVARQSYKEANEDAFNLVTSLADEHRLSLDIKYDPARHFYMLIPVSELGDEELPQIFINTFRRKGKVECQTLELVKLNQKISDAHNEVIMMSDRSIQELTDEIRAQIQPLFKISESIAMLDMMASFAQLVTTKDYIRPELTETFAIKAGRHPVKEAIQQEKYIPNDVYATQQNRLQIITGCNMSGKSTYIRTISLMVVMAQIGCFVPAQYASFPITHHIFARIFTDDNIEANVSTFAAEMREMAFILRNVQRRSLVIIDELGRGTSNADGLGVAIAIAEALLDSHAYVWFVTHFRDLARILQERSGVVNLHLAVEIAANASQMKMLYRISNGYEEEKFYGLLLARVVDLPRDILDVAAEVSESIHERNEARKRNKAFLAVARRRKLILSLKEQLIQAKTGLLEGFELQDWLRRLQNELVVRMAAIDAEAVQAAADMVEGQRADTREPRSERTTEWTPESTGAISDGTSATGPDGPWS